MRDSAVRGFAMSRCLYGTGPGGFAIASSICDRKRGAGTSSIRCTERPRRVCAIPACGVCCSAAGTGAGCIWCAPFVVDRADPASAEPVARSIDRCTKPRGCSPRRCRITAAPVPGPNASTPSVCRTRRTFTTSGATDSGSRNGTRERSAPSRVSRGATASGR